MKSKVKMNAVAQVIAGMMLVCASATVASAQASDGQGTDSAQTETKTESVQNSVVTPAVESKGDVPENGGGINVPVLGTANLMRLGEAMRFRALYGGSLSFVHDNRLGDAVNAISGSSIVASPYAGIALNNRRSQFFIQYLPTLTHYNEDSMPNQYLHKAAVFGRGQFTGRWQWEFDFTGSYGQNSLRFLAPLDTTAIGDVVAVTPGNAAVLPNVDNVTGLEAGAGIRYRKSRRDTIGISVHHSLYVFEGIQERNRVLSLRMVYEHESSARTSIQGYAQAYRGFTEVQCSSIGGGLGLITRPTARTAIEVSGGPQFSSERCGKQQAVDFRFAGSAWPTKTQKLYVLANRQFSTAYLSRSRWEDNVAGGYSKRVKDAIDLDANAGFVRTDAVDGSQGYKGAFVTGSVGYLVGKAATTMFTYRKYFRTIGTQNLDRDVFSVSLIWNPTPGHLIR